MNKNMKRIVFFVAIMMTFIFVNMNTVNATGKGIGTSSFTPSIFGNENGGGASNSNSNETNTENEENKEEVKHGANSSKWASNNSTHWNPCIVDGCTEKFNEENHEGYEDCNETHHYKCCNICDKTYNYVKHNFKQMCDSFEHWEECAGCGYCINAQEHFDVTIAVNNGSSEEHEVRCAVTWCDYNKEALYTEEHQLNQGDGIDEHKCECGYVPEDSPHHGFGNSFWDYCSNPLCDAVLEVDEGAGTDYISGVLPPLDEYYMIGSGKDWEKAPPGSVQYTTNYTPYVSEEGNEVIGLSMIVLTFIHGNYDHHAESYEESVKGRSDVATTLPKSTIRSPMVSWGDLAYGLETTGEHTLNASFSNNTYTITGFPTGHGWIRTVGNDFQDDCFEYDTLYYTGGKHTPPTDIYAFLNVGYRDMKGNKIIGAPEDLDNKSRKVVTWTDDDTGAKFTFSPNEGSSVKLDLEGLDKLGWRYMGYKHMKTLDVPSDVTSGDLIKDDKGEIETSIDDNVHTLVFFFEPIKVTVNHLNSDRKTQIITNKNLEYNLPEIINKVGHVCTSLECTHKTITEADRVPGTTATMHNNTSLNKYLWPGYILTDYELKTKDGTKLESTKYELEKDYPTNGEATTRTATSGDKSKYGENNIPQELYQKTVDIPVDIETKNKNGNKDAKGYRQDLILDFIYTNVDVAVSHRKYKTENILTDKENNPLAYTERLNGHYFILSSLILNGENTLPQTRGTYDYTGYILRQIKVTKKGEEIWNKEITYGQSATSGLEATAATTMLYYILSSNDVTSEIMNEINRIGSDIEFRFYYEKVPMLTIKHQDEYGNKLWPDEYEILNSESTPAYSKDLKKFTYVYKEYYLDDSELKTPGTEAVQEKADSDVRTVNVPRNGEADREIIFVYREDIPTLLVKYIDTNGNEILKTKDDAGNIQPVRTIYKMDKDFVSTSAKDLSGIKDEAGNSYNYIKYKLYEGDNVGTPVTNEENNVITVTVPKTGNNRLLEFIYEKEKDAIVIDPSQIKSESVILKSNYRPDEAGKNGEEYNVLRAIPTSEDLYANVITDSFLLSNVVSQKETSKKIRVKLVQPYYKTNNEDNKGTGIAVTDETYVISSDCLDDSSDYVDSEGYVELELPYSYFTAENVQLNIINRAVVKNESIEVRVPIIEENQVTLEPKYENLPKLEYTPGGELVFEDLALDPKYAGMTGKTVEEYVDGMAAGDYNLVTGFYNVKEDADGNISVEYVLPEIQYTEIDKEDMEEIVKEYTLNPYLLTRAAEVNNVKVTIDELKVGFENDSGDKLKVTVLSGAALPINREYTLIQLESEKVPGTKIPIIDTTPDVPLIGNNVLYKKEGIYITETQANQEYITTADVWYKPYQRVNSETLQVENIDNNDTFTEMYKDDVVIEETENEIIAKDKNNPELIVYIINKAKNENEINEILVESKKDIVGNSVLVHTPVVNNTYISKNSGIEKNQLINSPEDKTSILVLGHEFEITIPHSGIHINEEGYNKGILEEKVYNYRGLISDGDDQVKDEPNAFARKREIKFTFGVIYNNEYYEAEKWIDLGTSETAFTFIAPEWEKELWKNKENHKIETRVIAENATTAERLASTQPEANTVRENYVATKTIDVKLIGELLDLEIRATNDPGYSNYKTEGTSGMPIGQAGQANGGAAYKYGIKLGYSVYFDITSTGWTGDTTDKIELTPKYYYVSKDGGKAKEVDLYYKEVGNPNYVSLEGKPRPLTTTMSIDAIRGSRCKSRFASLLAGNTGFFNANAGIEMSNTTRLINALKAEAEENYVKTKEKAVVNYGVQIKTGNTSLVTLPYQVRLAYANAVNAMLNGKYQDVKAGLDKVSENAKNYCIGHWYGAFKLPATTVAVDPGSTPKPDKSNVKKNGYIIVSFEDIKSKSGSDETPYLEAGPERFALDENYKNFKVDESYKNFTLPNGKTANVDNFIPAIIYETDIPANLDAEVGGTH